MEAHAAATDPGSKAEGKYDTRSLEASYLAAGQARQVDELAESVRIFEAARAAGFRNGRPEIDAGALVEVDHAGEISFFLLVPTSGGMVVSHEGREITLLTPESGLYRKLLGMRVGESLDEPPLMVAWFGENGRFSRSKNPRRLPVCGVDLFSKPKTRRGKGAFRDAAAAADEESAGSADRRDVGGGRGFQPAEARQRALVFLAQGRRARRSQCAMFGARKRPGADALEDGAKVRVFAEASVYEARGQLQIIVQKAERAGTGDLQARFEALKRKLHAEGLFDADRKQPIPRVSAERSASSPPASGAALAGHPQRAHTPRAVGAAGAFPGARAGPGSGDGNRPGHRENGAARGIRLPALRCAHRRPRRRLDRGFVEFQRGGRRPGDRRLPDSDHLGGRP